MSITRKTKPLFKFLLVLGTFITWFPVLTPVFFCLTSLVFTGTFRFDYLMPAELFPIGLFGGVILFLLSLYFGHYRRPIGWGLFTAVMTLIGGQSIAVVSGLASGEIEPTGLPWILVILSLALYTTLLIFIGISAIKLTSYILNLKN